MFAYYLLAPLLYFLAYLPAGVLYRLADVIAFFLRVVLKYRKDVVLNNLKNSFPGKTEKEIQQIAKESYTYLADRIVETIHCIAVSKKEIDQRVTFKNPELLQDYYNKNRHVVFLLGHIASWEYGAFKLSLLYKFSLYAIVNKLSNSYFNRMIQSTREKMGMKVVYMQASKGFFKEELANPSLINLICDQSPSNVKRAYWTRFLNQQTAFMSVGERYAKLHNGVVVYPKMVQTKRGHYEVVFITVAEFPNETSENEITEKYVRLLEQHIIEHPADWLWSHKRWKHAPKSPEGDLKSPI